MKQNVTVNISIPEEILLSLRENTVEFANSMKLMSAIQLCEKQKLSIGQAAELAGLPEEDFIKVLGENKISIFGTINDISGDFQNA